MSITEVSAVHKP